MSSIEFSISEVLNRAWELTKKHGLILALFCLVVSMVGEGVYHMVTFPLSINVWIGNPESQLTQEEALRWAGTHMAIAPLLILIQSALQTGLMNMFLTVLRGGQPEISAFKLPVHTYVYFVLVSFLISIIIYLGILCCIIPGIWLYVRLLYAPLWVLDHPGCKVEEALKGSWRMTRGHFWNLFVLGVCACLITCLGLLACCIGAYFTGVIAGFAFVISYEILKPTLGGGDSSTAFQTPFPKDVPPVAPEASPAGLQVPVSKGCSEENRSAKPEPVSAGSPGVADGGASPAAVMESNEPLASRPVTSVSDGLCNVVLLDVGSDPEAVIRVVMSSVYGKGESEVRALLDTLPVVLMEKISLLQAERLKHTLEEAGAQVDIR